MIEQLLQSFNEASVEAPLAQPQSVSKPAVCSSCGGSHQWQPKRSEAWHCVVCQPPVVPGLVAFERGQPVVAKATEQLASQQPSETFRHVTSRYYYTRSQRCSQCHCRLVTETSWSDWSSELKCWTCGSVFGDGVFDDSVFDDSVFGDSVFDGGTQDAN